MIFDVQKLCFFRFPSSKAQTEGHRKTMLFTWESAAVARVFNVEHSPRRFAEEKQKAKQKRQKMRFEFLRWTTTALKEKHFLL